MATTNMKRSGTSLAGVSMLFFAVACGSSGSTTPGASSDVSSVEAELAAATSSKQSACTEASACFTTFKTCKAAAAADDSACRAALEACLPAEAPTPSCDEPSADAGPVVAVDAGAPAVPSTGTTTIGLTEQHADAGRAEGQGRGGRGAVGAAGDAGERVREADAGAGHEAQDGDGKSDESASHEGKRCEAPTLPQGALGQCRTAASSAMSTASDPSTVQSAHTQCVAHAFDDGIAKLCAKATSLCAQPSAPADICTRVSAACSAFASADAGT